MGTTVFGQHNYCGYIPHTHTGTPPMGADTVVRIYDQFGQIYYPDEIAIAPTINGTSCEAGLFVIDFADVILGSNTLGFNDPGLYAPLNISIGEARQRVVCQVFSDISALLNYSIPLSPNNRVHIEIKESVFNSSTFAAMATNYYAIPIGVTTGIVDNEVYKTIVNHQNSYINTPIGGGTGNIFQGYHGAITFNFNPAISYDYAPKAGVAIAPTDVDFYTVVLHEALHLLGIIGGVDGSGTSEIVSGTTIYPRFATLLNNNNTALVDISNLYTLNIIPAINPSLVNVGCNTPNPATNFFSGINNPINTEIYSPTTFSQPSSLSHFTCPPTPIALCPNSPINDYVMKSYICQGQPFVARHPNNDEYLVLCELGYQLTTTFGDGSLNTWGSTMFYPDAGAGDPPYPNCINSPCDVHGVNDITLNNPASIYLLGNDLPNPTNTTVVNLQHVTPVNSTLTPAGILFNYTPPIPAILGWDIFYYYPECNGVFGTQTYIYIWNGDIIAACPPSPCGANIVCMGGVEGIYDYNAFPLSNFSVEPLGNSPDLESTPMSYNFLCDPSINNNVSLPPTLGTHFVGLAGHDFGNNEEGVYFPLTSTLQAGDNITLSFWEHINNNDPTHYFMCLPDWEFYLSDMAPCPYVSNTVFWTTGCPTFLPVQLPLPTPLNYPTQLSNNWVHQSFNFIVPAGGPYDWLTLTGGNNNSYGLIDDVSIVINNQPPLNVSTFPDNIHFCVGQAPITISYTIQNPNNFTVTTNMQADIPLGVGVTNGGSFAWNSNNNQWQTTSPVTIAPSQSTTLTITIQPTMLGSYAVALGMEDACPNGDNECNITMTDTHIDLSKVILNPPPVGLSYMQGDVIHFMITVSEPMNVTNSPITNILMEDVLSPAFDLSSFTPDANNSLSASIGGNTLIFASFDLQAGGLPVTYGYSLTLAHTCPLGEFTNCAVINSADNMCNLPISSCVTALYSLPTNTVEFQLPNNVIGSSITYTGMDIHVQDNLEIAMFAHVIFDNCNVIMYPGVSLRIHSLSSLTLKNSHVYGCQEMWDRIELYGKSASLSCTNTLIEDGQYAIYATGQTNVSLNNVVFNKNVVGLYIPEWAFNGQSQNNFVSITMDGSIEFSSDGNFKNDFPTQAVPHGQRPLAGIYIHNNKLPLEIGTNGADISFQSQVYGIYALGTDVHVKGAKFWNCLPDVSYAASAANIPFPLVAGGTGIFARSSIFAANDLHVTGLGNTPSDPNSFLNCTNGIVGSSVNAVVRNNFMQGVLNGVILRLMNYSICSADIESNRILANWRGIVMQQNDQADHIRIKDNYILASGIGISNWTPVRGIDIQDGSGYMTSNASVLCNTIRLGRNGYGIRMLNVEGGNSPLIQNNDIQFLGSTGFTNYPAGISFQNSHKFKINSNAITGTGGVQLTNPTWLPYVGQNGLRFMGSNNNTVYCNSTDLTRTGTAFSMLCAGTTYKGNDIGSHRWGLQYSSTAATGDQIDAGNRWTGNYTGFGAENLNPNFGLSEYQIDFNIPYLQQPLYPPSINSGFGWFNQSLSANTYVCSSPSNNEDPNTCFYLLDPPPPIGDTEGINAAIAQGTGITLEYEEEILWEAQMELMQHLHENDSLLLDSTLQSFYQNQINAALGRLNHLRIEADSLLRISQVSQIQITSIREILNSYYNQLRYNDSLAHEGNLGLAQTIDSLKQLIVYQDSLLRSIYEEAQSIQNVSTQNIENQNKALVLTKLYQTNEQAINNVYFATIAIGLDEFDSSQVSILYDIANQCPLSGGSAVFRARAIYALINDSIEYNDYDLCLHEGLNLRHSQQEVNTAISITKPMLSIMPNPTNGNTNIQVSNTEKDKIGQLFIYDHMGRLIMEISMNEKMLTIDLSSYSNGIYLIRYVSGTTDLNGKLFLSN